jgi:hypothetical protein
MKPSEWQIDDIFFGAAIVIGLLLVGGLFWGPFALLYLCLADGGSPPTSET